jgi:glycosyltransferase involved in cell wall biosynthesis
MSVADQESGPTDSLGGGYRDLRFAQDFGRTPVLRHLRQSRALAAALDHHGAQTDIIHSHGLWLGPNIEATWAAARYGKPHVITPRGMLSPVALSFSRLKKRAFWALLQERAVRAAACLHATSEAEYAEFRALGLTNPVAIIPNGIDLPDLGHVPRVADPSGRLVLSLGRLHPKKGLDRLVRAWARLEASHPNWRLRIAGPAEGGHDVDLRALVVDLGLSRVSIEGPIYGHEKLRVYREADLFVLSTLNENFGLTVAEALAAETPVISTKGAPWAGLEIEGCGWWIDHGVEALATALDGALRLPADHLRSMGANGRVWMMRDFSWIRVAQDMSSVYRWLLSADAPPAVVRLD